MPSIFLDTSHVIALFSQDDTFHERSIEIHDRVATATTTRLITTVMVIEEFLTDVARREAPLKLDAVRFIQRILNTPTLTLIDVDRSLLERGIELYSRRLDKAYSMVACISMVVCRDLAISDVLTTDRDFEREGLNALLREA
jgi:hypothetical protein